MSEIVISHNNISKIKERAVKLAESINEVKDRGVIVSSYEPIEGKMFWPENK